LFSLAPQRRLPRCGIPNSIEPRNPLRIAVALLDCDMLSAILVAAAMSVTQARFGTMPDGSAVDVFTLTDTRGVEVRVITYGAAIASIKTPDRNGRFDDVVTGFDTLEGYLTRSRFFGAIAGRYANRIANARFTLNGRTYQLAANNGQNHLHGGRR